MIRRLLAALHPRPPPPSGPGDKPPPEIPPPTPRLLLGLLGTLLAGLSSYLNQYGTTFARADLYGGLGIGQDAGSWITVAFNAGSVAVVVLTAWLSSIVSPRRAVAGFLVLLTLAAVAVPAATTYPALVALAFLHGVGGGALVPLLLIVTLRVLPPHDRLWGFAAYAAVVSLSPLTGEIISGFFSEYIGWQAIFWENLLLNPVALVLVLAGLPVEPLKLEGFTNGADYLGMALFILFGTALTAALIVGQRFDWFSSPFIVTLFAVAGVFLALFVWQELVVPEPLINLRLLTRLNLALGLLLVVMFFFGVEGAAYVLPQYGAEVRSFRELQVGAILIVATVPVIALAPFTAWLLHRVDARVVAAVGFLLVAVGDRIATYVTSDWVRAEFLLPEITAACGYPLVLVCDLLINTSALKPEDALSGSALFNVVRVLASNAGAAIIGGIVTVRERVHSNIAVDQAPAGAFGTVRGEAALGGPGGLSSTIHGQAFVQAIADAYGWIAMIMLAAIVLLLFVREPPVPRRPAP